ncbi:MAG: cysteine desulfurase [Oligoflexia bacterium]|nr:cysteine desulfurase [Oligoflexia bacterium]
MRQIYLDHNSTTQMGQAAKAGLLRCVLDEPLGFANPSSIHFAGRRTRELVEQARDKIAQEIQLEDPEEIVFTSGATESINTTLKGFTSYYREHEVCVISSLTEHEATLATLGYLSENGATVVYLPVDKSGQINLSDLKIAIEKNAAKKTLVSLMIANNETGVVHSYKEIAKICREAKVFLHFDGAQALGKIENFAWDFSYDFLSLSAHKVGAAKGVGALIVKKGAPIHAFFHGGSQEKKKRAGTLNVAGIISFGEAMKDLQTWDFQKMKRLRDSFEEKVLSEIEGVSIQSKDALRLVNTSNLVFEGVRGESLLMALDLEGFAVSSGSACHSGSIQPSHVLLAMGFDKPAASSALRVSLGVSNTEEELLLFVAALKKQVQRIPTFSKSLLAK